jgi:membrane dipeptidase
MMEIINMIPIFDLHQDSLSRMAKDKTDFFVSSEGAVNYENLIKGHVLGTVFAMFSEHNIKKEIELELNTFNKICMSGKVRHITDASQINFEDGKINATLHLEGADLIGDGTFSIEEFYNLGLRSVGVVWMNSNNFAGGLKDLDIGLTPDGELFIKKCNELGIIIDVSHMNEKSFYDVLKVTSKPIMASHSNCYALNPNIRNIKDEQIKLIAKNNGIIGVSLNPVFIKDFKGKWIDPVENTTTFEEICAHITHIKNLVGIDYVALGSDFDGAPVPEVIKDSSKYQKLLSYLKTEGYSDEDIKKLAYKNFIRVFEAQKIEHLICNVDHIALELSNLDEGIKFFHQILGLPIKNDFIYKELRYIKIDAHSLEIELFENKNKILSEKPFLPLNSKGVNHIGIKVSNLDSLKHILNENHIEIIKDTYKVENKLLCLIALGPDNIEFQFFQEI